MDSCLLMSIHSPDFPNCPISVILQVDFLNQDPKEIHTLSLVDIVLNFSWSFVEETGSSVSFLVEITE